MTRVVDTSTGEVVNIATADEAFDLAVQVDSAIAHMNARTGAAIEALLDAFNQKAWIGLGFGSWDELVEVRRWIWKPLTSADRAEFSELLRNHGMSFRSIAKVIASSRSTVERDLAGVPGGTPDQIVGNDGKSYAPTRPQPEVIAPDEPHDDEPEPDDDLGEPALADEVPAGASVSPAGPPPDFSQFRDPEADWQRDFYKAMNGVAKVLRDYPADDVASYADSECIEAAEQNAQRIGVWIAAVKARRPNGLRVVNGGQS